MFNSVFAISFGASAGALLRWGLGNGLNHFFPAIPLGTLCANLLGGFLIGLGMTFFSNHPGLSPEYRLFFITGFLGALTTFSTFSAEVSSLIQRGEVGWAMAAVFVHVAGSILMTFLGMACALLIQRI